MNNADKIIKRCRALALAGMIGITSLGSSLPAFAAGPGDDSSRVSEISTGGPGDPGNTNSSNSTTNTGNSNNSNSNNNTNNTIGSCVLDILVEIGIYCSLGTGSQHNK